MKISERSKFIINKLIESTSYVTASEIAEQLKVSIKTITRQLNEVEKILAQYNLCLERKTSKGMRIIGEEEEKQRLIASIEQKIIHEYSPVERQDIILSQLLKSQEPIKLINLAKLLNVAEATISNDLDKLEPWIKKRQMMLIRRPGLGIYLEGLERDIRKAIINHIYEHLNEQNILDLLYKEKVSNKDITSNASKFLLDLVDKNIIQQVEKAVKDALKDNYNLSIADFSGLIVHLTLAVQRLLKGEIIKIDVQFLQKLQEKSEFAIALRISKYIEKIFQIVVPKEETAYITMHLLGTRNIYQDNLTAQYDNFLLIKIAKQIIAIAEQEANTVIPKKSKLLIGLVKHLGPAATRMKLHLEIRNPLLTEMQEKYPHWLNLAKKASKPLADELQMELPEAEIAYLAMHLGSALAEVSGEQMQKYNILVACPTGIGTSKLLATQLKSKFSNLQIKAIVSAVNIDYQFYLQEGIDFIVSTVMIEHSQIPVVVVNFMLDEQDKQNIIEQMQKINLLKLKDRPITEFKSRQEQRLIDKIQIINDYGKYIKQILDNFRYRDNVEIKTREYLYKFVSRDLFAIKQEDILFDDLHKRENKGSTIINNLMLLHTKTIAVEQLTVGVIHLKHDLLIEDKFIKSILILLAPDKSEEKALSTIGYISENIIINLNLLDILHEASQREIYLELEKIYFKYFKEKYQEVMEG